MYRLESSDGSRLSRYIVDQDTATDLSREVVIELASCSKLLYPLVGAVSRLEVQVRGPVVAEIFVEGASGAVCGLGNITGGH